MKKYGYNDYNSRWKTYYMQRAVEQVLESLDDDHTTFERAIDDAAKTYGFKPGEVVQAYNKASADWGSEAPLKTV